MILIWGQSNYGKVDVVPRLCYVTTRFFHLYYVPLIPLGSYVVLEGTENGNGFRGVPTSLSWRSVLAGWVRAVMLGNPLAYGLGALRGALTGTGVPGAALAVTAVFAAAMFGVAVMSARAKMRIR